MALTSEQAAAIAHRHGLTIADAASLRALADDERAADRIAAQFAAPADPTREFAKALFGKTDEPAPAPVIEPTEGNVVPREGNSPEPRPTGAEQVSQFVADVFDRGTRP